jgi:ketosteroid isomerase-like protein
MTTSTNETADTIAVRELVESWAKAVRAKDMNGILANHSPDLLMFDVPLPLESRGIAAYAKTWDLFFAWAGAPLVFDIKDLHVTAGNDVAFVAALMRCSGQWMVMHEHHSIPAS